MVHYLCMIEVHLWYPLAVVVEVLVVHSCCGG